MATEKKIRRGLARVIERYLIHWYAVTTALYALSIPVTIWVFPATTLLLTIVVLFSGFTASVASLASVLVDAEDDD